MITLHKRISAQQTLRQIFIAIFLLLLFLPLMQMYLPFTEEIASHENRNLEKKPEISFLKDFRRYIKQYDKYFNDNYGFRNILIRLNGILHLRLLNTPLSTRVVMGKNGWLFYDDLLDGISMKDFEGKATLTGDQIYLLKQRLLATHNALRRRNIHFLLVIVPNKHTVYPEYLPDYISRGKSTRLDQLTLALKKSNIDFLDLRSPLMTDKIIYSHPLYYQTDTHWNAFGAFLGYEMIIKRLRTRYPRIKALDLSDFSVSSKENSGAGDMAHLLNWNGLLSDTDILLQPRKRTTAPSKNTVLSSDNNGVLPSILVFHDSFGSNLIPFMSESFSRSVFRSTLRLNLTVIEQEKPDIVIWELCERYLAYLFEPDLRLIKSTSRGGSSPVRTSTGRK